MDAYLIKTKVMNVIKSGIYNGQIYDKCISFLDEFKKIEKYLSFIENYIPSESDTDEKINRLEKMYFARLDSLSMLAKETDLYLTENSDYYRFKA